MLVDIVSRNGNLLLNFPLPSNGMLDPQELKILDEITKWMAVNGTAIYGTRPWKTFGGGPATAPRDVRGGTSGHHAAGAFNERARKALSAEDVRYTRKGAELYAFAMGWPAKEALFPELALGGSLGAGKIGRVEMLGFSGKLDWRQDAGVLRVAMPPTPPCNHAIAIKVEGALTA